MITIKVKSEKQLTNAYNEWFPKLNTVINRGTFAEDEVVAIQKTCNTVRVSFKTGEENTLNFILK